MSAPTEAPARRATRGKAVQQVKAEPDSEQASEDTSIGTSKVKAAPKKAPTRAKKAVVDNGGMSADSEPVEPKKRTAAKKVAVKEEEDVDASADPKPRRTTRTKR